MTNAYSSASIKHESSIKRKMALNSSARCWFFIAFFHSVSAILRGRILLGESFFRYHISVKTCLPFREKEVPANPQTHAKVDVTQSSLASARRKPRGLDMYRSLRLYQSQKIIGLMRDLQAAKMANTDKPTGSSSAKRAAVSADSKSGGAGGRSVAAVSLATGIRRPSNAKLDAAIQEALKDFLYAEANRSGRYAASLSNSTSGAKLAGGKRKTADLSETYESLLELGRFQRAIRASSPAPFSFDQIRALGDFLGDSELIPSEASGGIDRASIKSFLRNDIRGAIAAIEKEEELCSLLMYVALLLRDHQARSLHLVKTVISTGENSSDGMPAETDYFSENEVVARMTEKYRRRCSRHLKKMEYRELKKVDSPKAQQLDDHSSPLVADELITLISQKLRNTESMLPVMSEMNRLIRAVTPSPTARLNADGTPFVPRLLAGSGQAGTKTPAAGGTVRKNGSGR